MPELADFRGEEDCAVEKRCYVLGVEREEVGEVWRLSKLLVHSERLRQALADLALRASENRRLLALHNEDTTRLAANRQDRARAGS